VGEGLRGATDGSLVVSFLFQTGDELNHWAEQEREQFFQRGWTDLVHNCIIKRNMIWYTTLEGVMPYQATPVVVAAVDRHTLEHWSRRGRTERRLADRARIVLRAAEGHGTRAIARQLHVRPATVSKWCGRFRAHGLTGLRDTARPGAPPKYAEATTQRILQQLDAPPPPGYARWNGRLVAEALGDVPADQVWAVLRRQRISLQRRRSWCVSTDPAFAAKAADVVGLYLHPPGHALVLCVDEKPHIQALERAQGYLKLPNGQALKGFTHEYKRHGTTTLFAALDVATGQVRAGHYHRRRRVDFLHFMNGLVAAYPARALHVILDNLNIHKPKRDRWLARHPQVHWHDVPTHASWLNMIEVWFSILWRAALRDDSFTAPRQVREAIDAFIAAYNPTAHPFEWTKEVVHQVPLRPRYADLRN
jgi:transposase